jgi:uncharacterized OsmC-like protein
MSTEIVTARMADRHGVQWEARDLRGRTDRPLDMGGKNDGPMASEHLLIALASCQTTTAWKIAQKRGVALDDVRIEAAMDFDDRGEATGIRLRIEVKSPGPEKDVLKVFELAERACTISKLLSVEPVRTVVHERM